MQSLSRFPPTGQVSKYFLWRFDRARPRQCRYRQSRPDKTHSEVQDPMPRGRMSQPAATAIIALLFIAQVPGGEAQIIGNQPQVTGTWRGNSECVIKNGACHDEINVYRFSELAARPGWFSGTGSKVVNGKEISMGTLNWQYDKKSHILENNNPSGSFRLSVNDDKIDGTLILLPDGIVYRRIHLRKMK